MGQWKRSVHCSAVPCTDRASAAAGNVPHQCTHFLRNGDDATFLMLTCGYSPSKLFQASFCCYCQRGEQLNTFSKMAKVSPSGLDGVVRPAIFTVVFKTTSHFVDMITDALAGLSYIDNQSLNSGNDSSTDTGNNQVAFPDSTHPRFLIPENPKGSCNETNLDLQKCKYYLNNYKNLMDKLHNVIH